MPKAIPKPGKNGNEQYRPHQTGLLKGCFYDIGKKKARNLLLTFELAHKYAGDSMVLSAGAVPGT